MSTGLVSGTCYTSLTKMRDSITFRRKEIIKRGSLIRRGFNNLQVLRLPLRQEQIFFSVEKVCCIWQTPLATRYKVCSKIEIKTQEQSDCQTSRSQLLYSMSILENFVKFTAKDVQRCSFSPKLESLVWTLKR